jgi:hypothetical protein
MASLTNIQDQYEIALQDYGDRVEALLGGTNVRDKSIATAITEWYSETLPLIKTVLVAANATGRYAVPGDWEQWSRIVSIETPIDLNPPAYFSQEKLAIHRIESGLIYALYPNPSGSFRLSYTTVHNAAAPTTIPSSHESCIGKYAASMALIDLASFFAKTEHTNLDSVNYRTKEQESRSVSKELRAAAIRELDFSAAKQSWNADVETKYGGWR